MSIRGDAIRVTKKITERVALAGILTGNVQSNKEASGCGTSLKKPKYYEEWEDWRKSDGQKKVAKQDEAKND